MKIEKLTYFLALGLAFIFAAAGCKTHSKNLTPLDASRSQTSAPELQPNPPLELGSNAEAVRGLPDWRPEDFDQDRTAFAADVVHFDYDSAEVKESEIAHVEAVAERLRSDGSALLLIEGHCDERGTEEYNRSLGERRALTLRDELSRRDIDSVRVQTRSYGEDQPVDASHNESAWQKNRRGEFVLLRPRQ